MINTHTWKKKCNKKNHHHHSKISVSHQQSHSITHHSLNSAFIIPGLQFHSAPPAAQLFKAPILAGWCALENDDDDDINEQSLRWWLWWWWRYINVHGFINNYSISYTWANNLFTVKYMGLIAKGMMRSTITCYGRGDLAFLSYHKFPILYLS